MTRFTLYHTATDTLGRVTAEIYTLDEQIHQEATKPLKTDSRNVNKGGETFDLESARKILQNTRNRRRERYSN